MTNNHPRTTTEADALRVALARLIEMIDAYTQSPVMAALQEHITMRQARAALASAAQPADPVTVEAVAKVVRHGQGVGLDWLIEGGISALAVGEVLVCANAAVTDDTGSGEVYLAPAAAAPKAAPALQYDAATGTFEGETLPQAAENWAQWCERRCLGGLPEFLRFVGSSMTRAAAQPAAAPAAVAGPSQETCQTCQGNGEVVTDWERYKHPLPGDVGDEAVAECQDCDGQGTVGAAPTTQAAPQQQQELLAEIQRALAFWLPQVPSEDHPLQDRIAQDAFLLAGYSGPNEPSANELGHVALTIAPAPSAQGDDFWPVDGNASRKQLIKQIGQMNYRLTALRQQNAGLVARVQRQAEALRNLQSAAAPAAQGEPLTDSYIQQVPDKCDRIVWRGSYYHLPINAARAAEKGAQP